MSINKIKKYSETELADCFHMREERLIKTLTEQKSHAMLFVPYNITPTEYRVLAYLYFSKGEAEPSVIADALIILRQTMTKLVDSLEKQGFVCRTIHPTDRRRIFIKLLPEGTEMAQALLNIETEYTKLVEACFSDEELDLYHQLFWRMQDARDRVLKTMLEPAAQEAEA